MCLVTLLDTVGAIGQGGREGGRCEAIKGRSRCLGYINWHGRPHVQGAVRLRGGGWSPAGAGQLAAGRAGRTCVQGCRCLRPCRSGAGAPTQARVQPSARSVLSEPGRPVGVLWGSSDGGHGWGRKPHVVSVPHSLHLFQGQPETGRVT